MNRITSKLTYSNVVSTLCLVLLLGGGTAYAATTMLPKNSVGARQIKNGAITPAKLSKASRSTFIGANGPRGATGDIGPQGPKGERGAAGADGVNGQNLTAETPLASGVTESGVFSAAGGTTAVTGAGALMIAAVDFVQPLPAALDEAHAIYVPGTSSAHCPGVGQADRGYLCVYGRLLQNTAPFASPEDPSSGSIGADVHGAQMFFYTTGSGTGDASGTWAVTAP